MFPYRDGGPDGRTEVDAEEDMPGRWPYAAPPLTGLIEEGIEGYCLLGTLGGPKSSSTSELNVPAPP